VEKAPFFHVALKKKVMKDLSIYFSPLESSFSRVEHTLGNHIQINRKGTFPELTSGGVAIMYVPEFRGVRNKPEVINSEAFREQLYTLCVGLDWKFSVCDLGNILPGNDMKDTWFALSQVVSELVKNNILPIVIGGGQDLTMAMYNGYESLEQMVNICAIDHKLDLGSPEEDVHSDGFLSHLLLQRPCYLFNHANIGLQAPFATKVEFDLFDKLYFDVCRLGEFNNDFRKAEPHLRNSDILSVDFQSIRASELRSDDYISPNGFYADQICQIAKYAGISDKLTSVGIFNYYPEKESGSLSALLAQTIWYLMDGVSQRKGDFPIGSKKDYFKFTVHVEEFQEDLVFYKSNKSDRWWMEVSYPGQKGSMYDRHHLVPCDKDDYNLAMKNEIPDLWWKTYQKLT
jgi:arginase family enzyme